MLFVVVLLFGYSTLMAQTNFRNITYAEAVAAAKKENKPVFIVNRVLREQEAENGRRKKGIF